MKKTLTTVAGLGFTGMVFAQDAAAASGNAQAGGGMMQTLFLFGAMFLIIYFLMIRPQQKKQKEVRAMLENLKKGDRVITSGGIIGKIYALKPDKNQVVIKIDDSNDVKIHVQKEFVTGVLSTDEKSDEPAQAE